MQSRKTIFTFLAVIIFVGCQSKEEKAYKLIKDDMFKILYDFSSYEPVETVLDSAYTSVYRDSCIREYAILLLEDLSTAREYISESDQSFEEAKMWKRSLYLYGSQYKEAIREMDESLEKAKEHMLKVKEFQNLIKKRAKELPVEFLGWQTKHRYRCKSRDGNYDIGDIFYLFDKKLEKIIHRQNLDDEEYRKLEGVIKEALKSDD
jgi:hypothetical protein